ncbi:HSF-type DNA-binding protein [Nitzschia inconspicua]|uniref:HSF-type DNA-binding protein n=1 Tax=Nitzschia inconspicua TaxID=303405 RepID=A0A9K3PIU5_9STRA|nr:HSF-type DNA-binding protein [Nitzschia inconspicua]
MTSSMDASDHDVAAGDTFPVKLMKLLHAAEQTGKTDIISWLGDGTKFKVHDKNRFSSEIMPHYFASSTYKSFQRSKNLWGFQTVSKGVHKGECSHPLFLRGDLNSCRKMVRRVKSDDGGDFDASEQALAGATSTTTSHVGPSSVAKPGQQQQQQQAGNVMKLSLLDSISSLNPDLLRAHQQQQQLASLNPLLGAAGLGGQNHNAMNNHTNALLSSLAPLGNGNGNHNLLSLLQQKMQAPAPAPVHSISTLQQLLQLAQQPPPQQPPPSTLNQQIMALLALQQQQNQASSSGLPDMSILSATTATAKRPPAASTAVLAPSSSPPLSAIDSSDKNSKSKSKGSGNKAAAKSKSNNVTGKNNGLREMALARGSKVVACRARGMDLDHNQYTAFFEIPKNPEHGMDLVCSYPACRNGGIKFLYCKYCDDVIAKRTFRVQHLHEDLVKEEAGGEKEDTANDSADISDDSNKRSGNIGDVPPKKRHKKNASNHQVNIGPNESRAAENVHEITNETSDSQSTSSSETGKDDAQGGEKVSNGAMSENMLELRLQWDGLLDERQNLNSKDDISAWLDKVVETSERFKKASRRSKRSSKESEKS